MSHPTINFLTIKSPVKHKICYYEWGDTNNKDILLCVHGLSRNGQDFTYLANKLEKNYRIIAIDVAGRGNSDYLNDPILYNYGTYLSDLTFLIKALKLNKISYLGTSMGGILGLMLAAANPNLIKKLILNDIGYFIPKEGLIRIAESIKNEHVFESSNQAKIALKKKLKNFSKMSAEEFEFIYSISLMQDNNKLRYNYDPHISDILTLNNIIDVDLSSLWLSVPEIEILLIRGENSDILTKNIANIMAKNKLVTLKIVQDCGHAPMLLNDIETKLIIDWLK